MWFFKTILLESFLLAFLFREGNHVRASSCSCSSSSPSNRIIMGRREDMNDFIMSPIQHTKLGTSCLASKNNRFSTKDKLIPFHTAFVLRGGARGRRGGGDYHDTRNSNNYYDNQDSNYDDEEDEEENNLYDHEYDSDDTTDLIISNQPSKDTPSSPISNRPPSQQSRHHKRNNIPSTRPTAPRRPHVRGPSKVTPPHSHARRGPTRTLPSSPHYTRDKLTSSSKNRNLSKRKTRPRVEDPLTKVKNLTQKSLSVATSATMSTLKTGGKAAYYITAPKFVSKREICGIWRFDQSIGSTACAANIEFTPRGDAITKYKGEENVTGYLFQSRNWPLSCTIEFEADAFQGPGDEFPLRYYYKGSFRRKIADKNVIKIVGKIYEVRKGRFGRGNTSGVEVGSFVARKRIILAKDGHRSMGLPTNNNNNVEKEEALLGDEYDDEDYHQEHEYDDDEYDDDDDDEYDDEFLESRRDEEYHNDYNYD